jgi:hypothetical protein
MLRFDFGDTEVASCGTTLCAMTTMMHGWAMYLRGQQ